MVKRYYCDYCNKSFQDNIQSRRRHLKGISHQRNRRLHYDAVMREQSAIQQQSQSASILHSHLSGEEILRQWLARHPEVVRRYQKILEKKEKLSDTRDCSDDATCAEVQQEASGSQENVNTTASTLKQTTVKIDESIPPDLEPFRDVLPPSLLPHAMKRTFPGSSEPAEWG